jgi:hypothetical protein
MTGKQRLGGRIRLLVGGRHGVLPPARDHYRKKSCFAVADAWKGHPKSWRLLDAVVELDRYRMCDIEEKSMAEGIHYKQEHVEQTLLDIV